MNPIDELKDKIRSKMEVARYFTGFITISTSLAFDKIHNDTFQNFDWLEKLFIGFGLFTLSISLGLCIVTMYAYDRELMPYNFWSNKKVNLTSEDQNNLLYCEMKKAWRRLFTPAVICFFISFIIFEFIKFKNPYIVIVSFLGLIFVVIFYKNYSDISDKIFAEARE